VLKEEEVIDTLLLKRAVVDTEEDGEEYNESDVMNVEHELVLLLDLLPPLSPLKSLPVTLDAKLKV
jgi:hypothetical protein